MSCYPFNIFERTRKEIEEDKKALQKRIDAMMPDEKAKYEKDKMISDGIVNLFVILLFASVSAAFLWLFI